MSYGAPPRPGLSAPRDWPCLPRGVAPRKQAPPSPPRSRRGHAPHARQGTCRGGASAGLISIRSPAPSCSSRGLCVTVRRAGNRVGDSARGGSGRAARAPAARLLRVHVPACSRGPAVSERTVPAAGRLRTPCPLFPGASTPALPCISSFRIPKSLFACALDLISLRPTRCP